MRNEYEELIIACRGIHAAIDRFDHLVCEELGVARNDLRCLHLLEFGPISTGEIATRLSLATGSVTALVDRLEVAGLVKRTPAPSDRRGVLVEIRQKAFTRLATVYKGFANQIISQFADYNGEELQNVIGVVQGLRSGCENAITKIFKR